MIPSPQQNYKLKVLKRGDQFNEVLFFTIDQLKHYIKAEPEITAMRPKYYYRTLFGWEQFHIYNGAVLTKTVLKHLLKELN